MKVFLSSRFIAISSNLVRCWSRVAAAAATVAGRPEPGLRPLLLLLGSEPRPARQPPTAAQPLRSAPVTTAHRNGGLL
jgi:hypothetical protein